MTTATNTTKAIVKAIVKAVQQADADASYAQEMSDLIDFGEFAPAQEPNYKNIVDRFNLNRETLRSYGLFVQDQIEAFRLRYPVRNFQPNYGKGIFCPLNNCFWHENALPALDSLYYHLMEQSNN